MKVEIITAKIKILISPALIILSLLMLFIAGNISNNLIDMREEYDLTATTYIENAPPMVAFTTVALGGFRGILADILWLRVSYLQDKGNYLEVAQLSDWIAKLEPRCTEIWSFHAWNMAYNISVMMPDYEDRWRWVNNGIELLRDKGLLYNPGAPKIYIELGWMFQSKIAANIDDAHKLYKQKLYNEMTALLGGGYPDYTALAKDPVTIKEMTEHYKLIPAIMQEVDTKYGPLDWRSPLTHSTYWGYRAKERAPEEKLLSGDRMIFQSLAQTFIHGNLACHVEKDTEEYAPNIVLLNKTIVAYQEAIKNHNEKTAKTAYYNFMYSAINILVKYDMIDAAKATYTQWQQSALPDMPIPPLDTLLQDVHGRNGRARTKTYHSAMNTTVLPHPLKCKRMPAVLCSVGSQSQFFPQGSSPSGEVTFSSSRNH